MVGLLTPCFVLRGGFLYTIIVPGGVCSIQFVSQGFVPGAMVMDEIDTCIRKIRISFKNYLPTNIKRVFISCELNHFLTESYFGLLSRELIFNPLSGTDSHTRKNNNTFQEMRDVFIGEICHKIDFYSQNSDCIIYVIFQTL